MFSGGAGASGNVTLSQAPASRRSDLPAGAPVDLDAAVLGDRGRGGSGQPEQPGQAGVDPHTGQALRDRHRPLGHQAVSAVDRWLWRLRACVDRSVSKSYPNSDRPTSRIAPPTTAGSATLNTGHHPMDRKSTTCPRSGPGRAEEPVHQVAQRAAEDHAQPDAHHGETSRRPIQMMPITTPRATSVSTQV